MITVDQEESFLQGIIAAAGFVNSGIKKMADNELEVALRKFNNAETILVKLIKAVRGVR